AWAMLDESLLILVGIWLKVVGRLVALGGRCLVVLSPVLEQFVFVRSAKIPPTIALLLAPGAKVFASDAPVPRFVPDLTAPGQNLGAGSGVIIRADHVEQDFVYLRRKMW
ncbi:MAG: hypothetical protein ACKVKF_26520, partial [Rhodobacterales bacterium]